MSAKEDQSTQVMGGDESKGFIRRAAGALNVFMLIGLLLSIIYLFVSVNSLQKDLDEYVEQSFIIIISLCAIVEF